MIIITTVDKQGKSTQIGIEKISDVIELTKDSPPKTVCWAELDDEHKIKSTNFVVIENEHKNARLNEELLLLLQQNRSYLYSNTDGRSYLIVQLDEKIDYADIEACNKLRELRDELGTKVYDVYKPEKEELNFEMPYYFVKNAKVCEGVRHDGEFETFNPDEQESVNDEPDNETDDENDGTYFQDETLNLAKNWIDLQKGHVYSTTNKTYIYNPKTGTYYPYTDVQVIQLLYLWSYFKQKPSASKIANKVAKAIRHLTYVETFPLYMDGKENVLVFENRALIPTSRQEMPYSPAHFARNKLNYRYDKAQICPNWIRFLDDTFKGDTDKDDKIKLLQQFMGLSLTNIVRYQIALLLFGAGSNGKSVILQIVELLVGKDNTSALPLKEFGSRFGPVKLHDKLVNIDADLEFDALKAEGKFKSVVAGDEITVEEKYREAFKMRPHAKLWMAANILPRVKNNSHGYYRRFMILEFNNIIPKEEQNNDLINELTDELSGILNWALNGLDRLLKNNAFTIPSSSVKAIKEYELENNYVKQFFDDFLEITDQSKRLKKEEVYGRFIDFLTVNNYPKIDAGRFGKELKALGVKDKKSGSFRYYHVKFKKQNEAVNDEDIETKQVV